MAKRSSRRNHGDCVDDESRPIWSSIWKEKSFHQISWERKHERFHRSTLFAVCSFICLKIFDWENSIIMLELFNELWNEIVPLIFSRNNGKKVESFIWSFLIFLWNFFLATELFFSRKERRSESLNRDYLADYCHLFSRSNLRKLIPKGERSFFSSFIFKFDRRFRRQGRYLIITDHAVYIISERHVRILFVDQSIFIFV